MDYYGFNFIVESEEDFHRDLLINALAGAGFDTFEEAEQGFKAYVPAGAFNEKLFEQVLLPYRTMVLFSYTREVIPSRNWNEVWESNFEPITVGKECYVRATFHAPRPDFPYEIVIDPKMAFGTGHHQTTSMMMEFMLEEDMKGRSVLDMGCGTGILAILAFRRGATDIVAIDYDPVCYESTIENARLNDAHLIKVACGSKEVIPERKFDIIFANINRNILSDQLDSYASVLSTGGELFISGFYEQDVPLLLERAALFSFNQVQKKQKDNWAAIKLLKG